MTRTKIIAVGNAYRGDDAAGLAVAKELHSLHLQEVVVLVATGEGTELMEAWRGEEDVVLVDAVRSSCSPGTIHRIDAATTPLPYGFFHYSTHAFGVAEAVELARALGELPSRLIVYGIEGESFRRGRDLSSVVKAAAHRLVERIAAEVKDPVPSC